MANAPQEVYPLSTQSGEAIPLDIVRPLASVVLIGNTSIAVPSNYQVLMVYCSQGPALLSYGTQGEAPVAGQWTPNSMLIPVGMPVMISMPPEGTTVFSQAVEGEDSPVLHLTAVVKWAGLGLANQYTKKF